MQGSSLLCCSNSASPSLPPFVSAHFAACFTNRRIGWLVFRSRFCEAPYNCLRLNKPNFYRLLNSGITEADLSESEYVEVGYIHSVHGLQGEVQIKPNTDFPELRFSKPGRRWLRQRMSGRVAVREVDLLVGRGHAGKKSWIVRFKEFDTIDKAQQLVGSTVLVKEEDRPDLDEGEFYTRDLIGMRVTLKETNEPIGTVDNVYNSGASDLLHVILDSYDKPAYGTGGTQERKDASGSMVWVPFVEAIVPDVDMDKREMLITPPKGLLELNLRSDERSKKERRQLEWKQRRKFSQRLIAAKKKLCEMEQKHVFDGFRFGEKVQRSLLADQILRVNSILLQNALKNIEISSNRWDFHEFFRDSLRRQMINSIATPDGLLFSGNMEKLGAYSSVQEKGCLLTAEGKFAIVLVIDESLEIEARSETQLVGSKGSKGTSCPLLQKLVCDDQGIVKIEDHPSVPLILVCPAKAVGLLQNLFLEHDYFSFDSKKVWFLEEEMLPLVGCSLEEQNTHKILMKSPWEILQNSVGSGGVISLFSSHNILQDLEESGVEYIKVCSLNHQTVSGYTLLGLVSLCKANVGIRVYDNAHSTTDESFDMIFSMKFMRKLTKQINKLHFCAIPESSSYVKLVDKDWVDVVPSSPNSFRFQCSIYSSLNACPSSKICGVELTE